MITVALGTRRCEAWWLSQHGGKAEFPVLAWRSRVLADSRGEAVYARSYAPAVSPVAWLGKEAGESPSRAGSPGTAWAAAV